MPRKDADQDAHPQLRDLPIGIDAKGSRHATDPVGGIDVPADRHWGARTQRSSKLRTVSVEGTELDRELDRKRIDETVSRSPMLVTALSPVIAGDHASKTAHRAADEGTTLRETALVEGVAAEQVDRVCDPRPWSGTACPAPDDVGDLAEERDLVGSRRVGGSIRERAADGSWQNGNQARPWAEVTAASNRAAREPEGTRS